MFDGRHCKESDLAFLVKETKAMKANLSNEKINLFLNTISRFDSEIAEKMRSEIKSCGGNSNLILKAIDDNVNVLKQNVIVDINEHALDK